MPRTFTAWERLLLPGILILAAGLRFRGLAFGLPFQDARPDEMSVVIPSLALMFAGLNPHSFHWPSLMLYAVAAIFRVAWEVAHWMGRFDLKFDMYQAARLDPTPYLLLTRTFVATSGVATVWLLYRLASRVFDRTTGLVAALFLAVAFVHVRDSHFGVTDIPMTALLVAAMLPMATTFERPTERRAWLIAGFLAGLAASTKYNGGLVAIVALASAGRALAVVPSHERGMVLANLARFAGCAAAGFLVGTPFAVLDSATFLRDLADEANHLTEGHGIILERGWIHHLQFTLLHGLGAPLLVAGGLGLAWLWTVSWQKALLVGVFPLAYYAYVGRGYTVFVRYAIPLVPFLCLTAAILLVDLSRRTSRAIAPALIAAGALLLAWPSVARDVAFDRLLARTDSRVLALDWLSPRRLPEDWVSQVPEDVIYPRDSPTRPERMASFNGDGRFTDMAGAPATPDWIIVAESPLSRYTTVPAALPAILARDYSEQTTIAATHGVEPAAWFDQQDQLFVPFVSFHLRDRPGPEIRIFKRR